MKNIAIGKIIISGYSLFVWNILNHTDRKYTIDNNSIKDALLIVK
jgi:hypothetical protein